MKALLKHISLWLLVSGLFVACSTNKQAQQEMPQNTTEMPKPGTPNPTKVDSIKHQLDLKRRGL